MATSQDEMYQLVWWTRRLFQQLRATSDGLLDGTGINASQRAVLEFLHDNPPLTVSDMAREKTVSRQHIQTLVNSLLDADLVQTQDNPAHKRAPLITLTPEGKKLFQKITRQESKVLAAMAGKFDRKDVATATRTLQAIHDYLQSDHGKK